MLPPLANKNRCSSILRQLIDAAALSVRLSKTHIFSALLFSALPIPARPFAFFQLRTENFR
jgi:hypothetical protein